MILCLGHERLWSDEIAAHVGRILKALPWSAPTTVRIAPVLDWDCLDAIADNDQIIVVDAVDSGHEPGTCFVEEVLQDAAPTIRIYGRHREVVKDIVGLVQLLAMEGPRKRLVFIGIERAELRLHGSLSCGQDALTVPLAVDSVLRALGAEVTLRRMVSHACACVESADLTDLAWDCRYQGAA